MPPGSKREKRLARQAENLAAFERKKLRQIENPTAGKRIAEAVNISSDKTVAELTPARERMMEWTRDRADVEGSWTWGPRSSLNDSWDMELHPFLVEYSNKTWLQIYDERTGGQQRRQKHIYYEVWQICREAQQRLIEIERDDVDTVFRFRMENLKRLYGVVQEHVFHVLWWDPDHKIYPVEPD